MLKRIKDFLQTPVHIAPLITFRIIIGAMMVFSTLRFMWLGWIEDHYINPIIHFKYYGFEWVTVLPAYGLYAVHSLMVVAALFVMLGYYFRIASVILFLTFTYTELIDLTYYLNHYYFVSLILLLLIFTPAHRFCSIDSYKSETASMHIPRIWIFSFQLLLGIVYTYAGLAKINTAWLIEALPLKIWLPAHDTLPLIGQMFTWNITPYIFSWLGMLFDCTIVWWLVNPKTRLWAYATLTVFHVLTGLLFQIGVFPLVMIGATLIFFSEAWHIKILNNVMSLISVKPNKRVSSYQPTSFITLIFIGLFFLFQLVFPWRYLLYPGNIFWTEEGYRYSWRVMLMEKAGTATFYVKDTRTGREGIVVNSEFLNPHQEKQMAMQPDMILQFAHYLKQHYQTLGVFEPSVRAEIFVTLNARPSQLLIDPQVDLTSLHDGWRTKEWLLPAPN